MAGGGGRLAGTAGSVAGAPGSGASVGGGAAGEPGVTSDAGAAGERPVPDCARDADCDDKLVCNGTETCVDGKCAAGTVPCTNPDTAHCEVTCAEPAVGATQATCSTRGADKDHDSHRSKLCTPNPGDDCDDGGATVYPGAPEVCDGLDNDCNGKTDLDDGLALSGTNAALLASQGETGAYYIGTPQIVWAPEPSVYGVAWSDSNFHVRLAIMESNGAYQRQAPPLGSAAVDPQIGWSGSAFGLAWSWGLPVQAPPKTDVTFQQVDATGKLLGTASTPTNQTLASPKAVGVLYPGAWAQFWRQDSAFTGYESSALPIPVSITPPQVPRMAVSGTKVLVAWADTSGVIKRSIRDQALLSPSDASVSVKSANSFDDNVVVAAVDNGFAVAWKHDPDTSKAGDEILMYTELDAEGATVCGPAAFPDPIKSGAPSDLAANSSTRVITVSTADAGTDIMQVRKGCAWGPRKSVFTVPTGGSVTAPRIAGGQKGFALVWTQSADKTVNTSLFVWRRALGSLLCN